MRKHKFYTSAWLLEHSLEDNPLDVWRGDDSRIANLIKNNQAYLDALDRAIENSNGKTLDDVLEGVRLKKGDLYYSLHKVDIKVLGDKRADGKWHIKSFLSDKYDFTEIQSFMGDKGELTTNASIGTLANDAAVYSQKIGAIKPYWIRVHFNIVR